MVDSTEDLTSTVSQIHKASETQDPTSRTSHPSSLNAHSFINIGRSSHPKGLTFTVPDIHMDSQTQGPTSTVHEIHMDSQTQGFTFIFLDKHMDSKSQGLTSYKASNIGSHKYRTSQPHYV